LDRHSLRIVQRSHDVLYSRHQVIVAPFAITSLARLGLEPERHRMPCTCHPRIITHHSSLSRPRCTLHPSPFTNPLSAQAQDVASSHLPERSPQLSFRRPCIHKGTSAWTLSILTAAEHGSTGGSKEDSKERGQDRTSVSRRR
jgi:hypothetical protein